MDWVLHRVSLTAGVYRGLLVGAGDPPALEMRLDGRAHGHLTPNATGKGDWTVEGEIGVEALTEGTHGVTIVADGQVLDSLTIIAGLGAPEDLRAELDALRAELELVKTAFRRAMSERG